MAFLGSVRKGFRQASGGKVAFQDVVPIIAFNQDVIHAGKPDDVVVAERGITQITGVGGKQRRSHCRVMNQKSERFGGIMLDPERHYTEFAD